MLPYNKSETIEHWDPAAVGSHRGEFVVYSGRGDFTSVLRILVNVNCEDNSQTVDGKKTR